jgi:hypothetical protein
MEWPRGGGFSRLEEFQENAGINGAAAVLYEGLRTWEKLEKLSYTGRC